jgi:hypothetical protein
MNEYYFDDFQTYREEMAEEYYHDKYSEYQYLDELEDERRNYING